MTISIHRIIDEIDSNVQSIANASRVTVTGN
jgi:hypothetical protein